MKKNNSIGLIGGMGPYASSYFYKLLLDKSSRDYSAKKNDDYPEILLDSVPVPDFISDTERLGEAKDLLLNRILNLNKSGCGVIGLICNTGHILFPELSPASGGKLVSMIELVSERAKKINLRRVGVLATQTTISSNLYNFALAKRGIVAINADQNIQIIHEVIIRQLISGQQSDSQIDLLEDMTRRFINKEKLDGIILGCTELPLVFPKNKFTNVIDCLDVLADELLFRYYSRRKA